MVRSRQDSKCRTIESLLAKETSPLQNLVKKAQRIQQLGQKLEARLDPSLQGNFTLANIHEGVATILADSSAWATRLRYQIPVILDVLTNQLGQNRVTTVRIKIAQQQQDARTEEKQKISLSSETASYLTRTADAFGDSPIRDSLLKIASNQKAKD